MDEGHADVASILDGGLGAGELLNGAWRKPRRIERTGGVECGCYGKLIERVVGAELGGDQAAKNIQIDERTRIDVSRTRSIDEALGMRECGLRFGKAQFLVCGDAGTDGFADGGAHALGVGLRRHAAVAAGQLIGNHPNRGCRVIDPRIAILNGERLRWAAEVAIGCRMPPHNRLLLG